MSTPTDTASLPVVASGDASDGRPPVVLLHGFAGDALAWAGIQPALDPSRRCLAVELPGHGKARDWPERGNAAVSAKALGATLGALGIPRAHVVGHSMGGAVACVLAMRAPEKVASLTLLAPGGFGPEINARLLRRFARATSIDALGPLVEGFFGFRSPVPPDMLPLMAAVRADPLLLERYKEVVEAILDGDGQKTLPMDRLEALDCPVRVIWGDADNIVPVHQVANAPDAFAVHVLSGIGHMPHLERADLVTRLVEETVASGER